MELKHFSAQKREVVSCDENMNPLTQQIESKLKELAQETDDFRKSEFFQNYLDTMSKFWDYSYQNQLLIHFSLPTATRVAGYRTWQKLGRQVQKGCKAISILAPFTYKNLEEEEETYFHPVSVFDISQTSGQELPAVDVELSGSDFAWLWEKLLSFCSSKQIPVKLEELGVNGVYGYCTKEGIVISSLHAVNSQVATLIHEIAHALLHRESSLNKQQKEIQAESVAYVVSRHFGLDARSMNYLALYDADYKKIMENLSAISETAKEVIDFISFYSSTHLPDNTSACSKTRSVAIAVLSGG